MVSLPPIMIVALRDLAECLSIGSSLTCLKHRPKKERAKTLAFSVPLVASQDAKDRNADSTRHHHIAGGRCTARIDLSFLRKKFGIANLKHCTSGVFWLYVYSSSNHTTSPQKIVYGTPMCTQSCLAATLIKRAHGANKSFFVFFGFIPMQKSQRDKLKFIPRLIPHCSEAL